MRLIKLLVFVWISELNPYVFMECRCIESYMTICDSLLDVLREPRYKKQNWFHLLVQGDRCQDIPQYVLKPDHLEHMEFLVKLIVTKQVNKIYPITLPSSLKYVIFNGNMLRSLATKTFTLSHRMQQLSLQNNELQSLSHNFIVFLANSSISSVNLSYNKLKFLKSRLFSTNSRIGELDLRHNNLIRMRKFSLPSSLKILRLDHNNIRYLRKLNLIDQNLNQLEYLTINHNKLRQLIDLPVLESLKYLDISYNYIHKIGSELDIFRNVRKWSLDGNGLMSFKLPAFLKDASETGHPYEFWLANNNLRNLTLEPPYPMEITFTLRGNPWNCRCFRKMEETFNGNKDKLKVRTCDLEMIRSGKYPYCAIERSFEEECVDEEFSDDQWKNLKTVFPKDDDCVLYLPMTYVRNV